MKTLTLYLSSFSLCNWLLIGLLWILIPLVLLIILAVVREIREDRRILREARKPYEHLFKEAK